MEPILIYGVPAGCSFGSIVALEWLGRPYRLCRAEMPRDLQTEGFARLNPVRETPVLLTSSGLALSESAAILPHIAALDPARGLAHAPGTDAQDRLQQVFGFLNTSFFAAFSPLWTAYEMQQDPPVQSVLRDLGRRQVTKAHDQLEQMLAGREWLAGPQRTLADAYFSGLARWADYHGVIDAAAYPRIQQLRQRLDADPGVQFAKAIEAGESPRGAGGFQGHVTLDEALRRLPSKAAA